MTEKLYKMGPFKVLRPTKKGEKFEVEVNVASVEILCDIHKETLRFTPKQFEKFVEIMSIAGFYLRHGALPGKPSKKSIKDLEKLLKQKKYGYGPYDQGD